MAKLVARKRLKISRDKSHVGSSPTERTKCPKCKGMGTLKDELSGQPLICSCLVEKYEEQQRQKNAP